MVAAATVPGIMCQKQKRHYLFFPQQYLRQEKKKPFPRTGVLLVNYHITTTKKPHLKRVYSHN